jgi:hypothetical protein
MPHTLHIAVAISYWLLPLHRKQQQQQQQRVCHERTPLLLRFALSSGAAGMNHGLLHGEHTNPTFA